jgi:cytochrome c553
MSLDRIRRAFPDQPGDPRFTRAASSVLLAAAAAATLATAVPDARAADAARVEEIVQGRCLICHGPEGENSTPAFPRLAGQNADYVARQLAEFRSGRRANPTMRSMVEDLTPADFAALGAYYASRPTYVHPLDDASLGYAGRVVYTQGNVASGVSSCVGCHGPTGHGTDTLPRLAGQHAQYLARQLRLIASRERPVENAVMQSVASRLTEQEMRAVTAWLSSLK